jgi:RHS repeat-associated protein
VEGQRWESPVLVRKINTITLHRTQCTYDSFGNLTASTGSLTNYFRFTGREFDTESGLYFLRNRYYDSLSGRFWNEDPLGFAGDDVNFYTYVQNSPVSLVDPFGLEKKSGGPWHPEPGVKFACQWEGTPVPFTVPLPQPLRIPVPTSQAATNAIAGIGIVGIVIIAIIIFPVTGL